MKRVLFLCAETFPPQYAFLECVFNDILPKHGYQFVWIMPSIKVDQITKTEWNGSSVWLLPKVRPSGLIGLFRDYIAHFLYIREAVRQALEEIGSIDIVQVRDDPIMAFVAWGLSKRLKVPFVYQVSHLKEEENILYAKMKLYGNPIKNYLKGRAGLVVRNWLLRKADLIFPISDQMKETLAKYGVSPSRMVALPEGVDALVEPSQFDSAALKIRRELGIENKRVMIYVGTMNRLRGLDLLLRALKSVRTQIPAVHLLMVGDGREPEDIAWLREAARELDVLDRVTFMGMIPRAQVSIYIRASDIGLSPVPPNFVYLNSSPIKILEYLALEIPCVASDIPSQRHIIEESQGGLCVAHEETAFTNAIVSLLKQDQAERKAMGKKGHAYVSRVRDFKILADKVLQVYNSVLKNEPAKSRH